MNILRFFEISLARHQILNPITAEKFALVGELFRLEAGVTLLDLACGRGEMLSTWAARHGTSGVGVDISEVFLESARARAGELEVSDRVSFVQDEAARYARASASTYDRVACIGATWIGGGLAGTLELIRPLLSGDDSLVAIGEPYWIEPPPEEAYVPLAGSKKMFVGLDETRERCEDAGFELIEMVMADHDSWDRYEAAQWTTMADWLRANPQHPEAVDFAQENAENRRNYLRYGRRYLGWGIFILAPRS